jgi:hypothetical protein
MIRNYRRRRPLIAQSAYVDRSAQVIGNVDIGERSSVWCNATIRGDIAAITIGEESNIQDNCCLHVDPDAPLRVGDRVVVGHSVTLHGCTVEDDCLIGMGAVILSGAHIGAGSIVAAGALGDVCGFGFDRRQPIFDLIDTGQQLGAKHFALCRTHLLKIVEGGGKDRSYGGKEFCAGFFFFSFNDIRQASYDVDVRFALQTKFVLHLFHLRNKTSY